MSKSHLNTLLKIEMIDQTSYHSIDYFQRAYYKIEHGYK